MEATCEEDEKEIQYQIKKHMNKYRKEGIYYIILYIIKIDEKNIIIRYDENGKPMDEPDEDFICVSDPDRPGVKYVDDFDDEVDEDEVDDEEEDAEEEEEEILNSI